MSERIKKQAEEAAAKLGHEVKDDPPAWIDSMSRLTCIKCGFAVIYNDRHFYGSASEDTCNPKESS